MEEYTEECWGSPNCFSPPLLCVSSSRSHLKAGYVFSRSKSLGRVPYVHELEREGAGLCIGTPSQRRQLSLLAQVLRDETMSSGDFLQIQQPWPYQNAQLCLHHTSLITSLSFFLSSIHRSNTVCFQQSVNFLDQQRDIHFAQHSFNISIVFDFPLPLPTSPENDFFLVLITWTTVKVDVFLSILQDIFFRRDKTEANRVAKACE